MFPVEPKAQVRFDRAGYSRLDMARVQGMEPEITQPASIVPDSATDADIVLPVCASDEGSLYVSTVGIRTCAATAPGARIMVMCNNTEGKFRQIIESNCVGLGLEFYYIDGPFSISRVFNRGARLGTRKYIAYCTADVIYYHGWLENLISLWNEHPDYFALATYSFDIGNNPCVPRSGMGERRIVDTHNPSSGVLVLKRESGYVWDENFPLWEIDADFLYYIERNGLRAGYCLNARCDHMIEGIRRHIDYGKNFGMTCQDDFFGAPRRYLEQKWGLGPP